MKYQVIRWLRNHLFFFCIIAKVGSSLVRNGLYMMKILNWVYRVKKISRHNKSLNSFLKSSHSGSFTSALASGHLYHLYPTYLDNLRWNNISVYEKKTAFLGICWHFLIQVAKFHFRFKMVTILKLLFSFFRVLKTIIIPNFMLLAEIEKLKHISALLDHV